MDQQNKGPVTAQEIAERFVVTMWPVVKSAMFDLMHSILNDVEARGIDLSIPETPPAAPKRVSPPTAEEILDGCGYAADPPRKPPILRPEDYSAPQDPSERILELSRKGGFNG